MLAECAEGSYGIIEGCLPALVKFMLEVAVTERSDDILLETYPLSLLTSVCSVFSLRAFLPVKQWLNRARRLDMRVRHKAMFVVQELCHLKAKTLKKKNLVDPILKAIFLLSSQVSPPRSLRFPSCRLTTSHPLALHSA